MSLERLSKRFLCYVYHVHDGLLREGCPVPGITALKGDVLGVKSILQKYNIYRYTSKNMTVAVDMMQVTSLCKLNEPLMTSRATGDEDGVDGVDGDGMFGAKVGDRVGIFVGTSDGMSDSRPDGTSDGTSEGNSDGVSDWVSTNSSDSEISPSLEHKLTHSAGRGSMSQPPAHFPLQSKLQSNDVQVSMT